jgi:hypothetical protein
MQRKFHTFVPLYVTIRYHVLLLEFIRFSSNCNFRLLSKNIKVKICSAVSWPVQNARTGSLQKAYSS